jgi:Fe-S cluster assembly protein SufD
VGSLDAEQIYYLRTRGFTEVAARQILVEGFFENVVSRVPHAFIQEHVRAQLAEKMR